MKAPIRVVSEAEFNQWLSLRQQKNAAAAASPSPSSPAKAAETVVPLTVSQTNPTL